MQQALLIAIFKSTDAAAFSVGQQIATAVLSSALGFAALVLIFRFKSFREVIARGREHRRDEARGRRPQRRRDLTPARGRRRCTQSRRAVKRQRTGARSPRPAASS